MNCSYIWCGAEMILDMQSSLYEHELKYTCPKCGHKILISPNGIKEVIKYGV